MLEYSRTAIVELGQPSRYVFPQMKAFLARIA